MISHAITSVLAGSTSPFLVVVQSIAGVGNKVFVVDAGYEVKQRHRVAAKVVVAQTWKILKQKAVHNYTLLTATTDIPYTHALTGTI